MAKAYHVKKKAQGQWIVAASGARRASSVHRTQAEAVEAGRRLALKSGGAEVVVHGVDGRLRQSSTLGAAAFDAANRQETEVRKPASRARRTEGPRTTLRVPDELVASANRLAQELAISRNDALLRLATRGARIYELEESIAVRRAERWAAVVPGVVDVEGTDFPSPEEARAAVLARDDEGDGIDASI